jgi:hypothetical protein
VGVGVACGGVRARGGVGRGGGGGGGGKERQRDTFPVNTHHSV